MDTQNKSTQNRIHNGESLSGDFRWISYISLDRRILWSEAQGDHFVLFKGRPPDFPDDIPQSNLWQDLIDLSFLTLLPQQRRFTYKENGQETNYSVKLFPDLKANGQIKGVVQVLERLGRHRPADIFAGRTKDIHSVADLIVCGLIFYDPPKDRIFMVNRLMANLSGYTMAELESMPGKTLFGDLGVTALRDIFERMLKAEKGILWGQVLALTDRAGQKTTWLSSLRVGTISAWQSNPLMLISFDALESDFLSGIVGGSPKSRFIQESMQQEMWEYHVESSMFYYGQSCADIFGPDGLPEGPGKNIKEWAEAVHPDDMARIREFWDSIFEEGEQRHWHYRIRDPQGKWRWIVSALNSVLNSADGHPLHAYGFVMEISEAMQSEAKIIDAEERLRIIFSYAGLGIAVTNIDGTIERVNPALAKMLGREQNDFVGRWLPIYAHPDSREVMHKTFSRLVRSGRREILQDCLFLRPDGQEVWTNLTSTLTQEGLGGIRYVVTLVEDVTIERSYRQKLQYDANHDAMTGAWSRGVLMERLGQHISLAIRYHQPMSFCLCDLDYFKQINDLYGHQEGDQVLIRFVKILQESVRETDVVGRYGGEEFGIVFPNTNMEGAQLCMERALNILRAEEFVTASGVHFNITATFGISGVTEECDEKMVIGWADDALYKGKAAGRNQVALAILTEAGQEWFF